MGARASVERLAELLKGRGEMLAVAETTAGGLVCAAIVGVPGCSAYFERGVVAYSKASKTEMIGVDERVLAEHGAVSEAAAAAMAEGVRAACGVAWGIAETGIAGPIRGRSPKPLGTACLAVAGENGTETRTVQVDGDRHAIREGIAAALLAMTVEVVAKR